MIEQSTICAISTSPGTGAIAVIRLSGSEAIVIADKVFRSSSGTGHLRNKPANSLYYGQLIFEGEIIDEVIVSLFRAPHSYTGEDTVEISCHGSVYIQQKILETLVNQGATLAKPGEFTQRAFFNG